jgi:hypothetical protein
MARSSGAVLGGADHGNLDDFGSACLSLFDDVEIILMR